MSKKKYVCISIQSTSQLKYWNYPRGWESVTAALTELGYDVFAIDKHASFGSPTHQNRIPAGAKDRTGMELKHVIALLKDASLFIGTSSGLSWLAWSVGTPSVLISGMTDPFFEFKSNSARVHNAGVCHGCFNDVNIMFDRGDWMFCPRHKDTPQQFECTKSITPKMVMTAVNEVLGKKIG